MNFHCSLHILSTGRAYYISANTQMGLGYKRITNNGAYGEAALEEALIALKHGESYRRVERE